MIRMTTYYFPYQSETCLVLELRTHILIVKHMQNKIDNFISKNQPGVFT